MANIGSLTDLIQQIVEVEKSRGPLKLKQLARRRHLAGNFLFHGAFGKNAGTRSNVCRTDRRSRGINRMSLKMLDPTLQKRYRELLTAEWSHHDAKLSEKLKSITQNFARRGLLHSGSYFSALRDAHSDHLGNLAKLAFDSLIRVHRANGSSVSDTIRADLKAELVGSIGQAATQQTNLLRESVQARGGSVMSRLDLHQYDLQPRGRSLGNRFATELDLHVDQLMTEKKPPAFAQFTFNGPVGAVQTGVGSRANVVQNLSQGDRDALRQALTLVKELVAKAPDVDRVQRAEIIEIADDCAKQIGSVEPVNSTRVQGMLTLLATTIQTIGSAQPAYDMLRSVLAAIGLPV